MNAFLVVWCLTGHDCLARVLFEHLTETVPYAQCEKEAAARRDEAHDTACVSTDKKSVTITVEGTLARATPSTGAAE